MDVLILAEDHHTAIFVPRGEIDALLQQQIIKQTRADPPEVTCKDAVVVVNLRIRRAKVAVYGVRRRRC